MKHNYICCVAYFLLIANISLIVKIDSKQCFYVEIRVNQFTNLRVQEFL